MAKIQLTLSSRKDDRGQRQVMIRLFEGSKVNMRGKSRIYICEDYFHYFINIPETIKIGVPAPESDLANIKEAKKKGYVLYQHGEIVIPTFRQSKYNPTKPVEFIEAENKRTQIDTLVKEIMDSYQTVDKTKLSSGWMESIINYFHNKEEIERELQEQEEREEEEYIKDHILLNRFEKYIDDALISETRRRAYRVTYRILKRFLNIFGLADILIEDFTADHILLFRQFIIDEYKYADKKKWKYLYKDVKKDNIPTEPRVQNTVATKLKMFRAFFSQLEDADEIVKSPFKKMGKENREASLKEAYVQPVALTLEEFIKVKNTSVPESLSVTKDAFLVQCALGCRISDFKIMTMQNVAVTGDGIPYIRYVPQKTRATMKTVQETKTPIVRFAFDIIKRTGFNIPIINYDSGKSGYNKKIKDLLKLCELNREVDVWNERDQLIEHKPLWEVGSSKLGRKTNVTLMGRVQIDLTKAGLHQAESDIAKKHYYDERLMDIFQLISRAFGEQIYFVDKELNLLRKTL